ncbi:DUF2207 domain-containing protein [Tessaracoccus sp. HDW20]|uniref:DUF2207 domain-containing protein n=1 Tax=Tessaracoccus coleopterorum TaxID=2714950 RepID=UPI0018D428D3|nr:DUF2207 domain-containing protein [Tessaracoccus coleopterorum]NHB84666.1 DUF2207 domain-containing protein [Tessaracoccus coleopterorum]
MELGFLVIAVLGSGALFAVGALANRFFHDRIFVGLTPGLVPPVGQSAPITKVQPGREYSGEVAVAFSPPRGLRPGLVGTIVDGQAEMRDITATVVDLAVRGWLRIKAVDADAKRQADPKKKARDWQITAVDPQPAGDRLDPFEERLLRSLFSVADANGVLMSRWTQLRGGDVRGLQNELYAQTVNNGWYDKDPRSKSAGCLAALGWIALGAYCLLMFVNTLSLWTLLSAGILIGAAVFAARRVKRRVPRTATGTAAMIQALGFKKYLATAEADQFSSEEAAGIFSRYLPYALVFGVAAHWAKVFGDVAKASEGGGFGDGGIMEGLLWMDLGVDFAYSMAMFGDFDAMFDIGDVLGGIGDVADGLGGFVEGIGDFISDLDFDF